MKKTLYDYRGFHFTNINDPRFSHLKLLLGWVGYFILYFLTENLIPLEKCHPIHCWLDDVIPFCELFLIPYCFWYLLIFGSLLYFLLFNVDNFRKLQTYIIITQVVAMFFYIVLPTRQDLRPAVFERDNFLTSVMAFIYSFDTSSGVCPSLHVAYSIGIASVWTRDRSVPPAWKAFVIFSAALISIATAFVKQHSVLDILAALPVCVLAEWLVFYKNISTPRISKNN